MGFARGSVCGTRPPGPWPGHSPQAGADTGCPCHGRRLHLELHPDGALPEGLGCPLPAHPVAPGGLGEGLWLPQLLLGGWGWQASVGRGGEPLSLGSPGSPCPSWPWGLSVYMEHLPRGFPVGPWTQCPRLPMPESPQLDEVLPTVCCPEGPVLLLVLLVGSSLLPWKLVGLALCTHVWHISGTPGVIPSQHHVGPGGH